MIRGIIRKNIVPVGVIRRPIKESSRIFVSRH